MTEAEEEVVDSTEVVVEEAVVVTFKVGIKVHQLKL
jgi:hypothetical protein